MSRGVTLAFLGRAGVLHAVASVAQMARGAKEPESAQGCPGVGGSSGEEPLRVLNAISPFILFLGEE